MPSVETGQIYVVPESSGLPSACGNSGSTRRGLTRGEESEEGGERGLLYEGRRLQPLPFSMFLGGLKIDAKNVPTKSPTLSPKGTPKLGQHHQHRLRKPSQNGAAARVRFSLFDKMCLWHPFGFHFGGVLGVQMEAKAIKKPLQKTTKK